MHTRPQYCPHISTRCRTLATGLALAVVASLTIAVAHADSDHDNKPRHHHRDRQFTSQDRATQLRESGAILPLVDVIRLSGVESEGQVSGVELEMEDDRPVYELKVLTKTGRVRKYHVDPSNGHILEVE
ncbi:PepSY domain-containing protein [Breoghania sp.]|uniref:PepSY domain-containing protein n=1 Tax=Breoghania sp. TaxID=2065378 RepID=UPI00262BDBDD|nr:PepSY domain-containing protein [Breoghania sp.]MDJ0931915.1 PepSY domain-containing protein [Breoghania sp.]